MIRREQSPTIEISDNSGIKTRNFFKRSQIDIGDACSDDPYRPELQGVVLNFKDKIAIATEGHFMVQLPIESPDELVEIGEVLVPRAFFQYLKMLLSGSSAKPVHVELEFTRKMVIVSSSLSDAAFSYLRQPIPDYRKVTFNVENPISIKLNPELLLRLREAAGVADQGVLLTFDSKEYVAPMTVTVGRHVIGAIMPMRLSEAARDESHAS